MYSEFEYFFYQIYNEVECVDSFVLIILIDKLILFI